mgnify:CR=1 FL=1
MCIGVKYMNRDTLRSEMERVFSECLSIMDSKNKDYAKDRDPFANLRTCEILGITLSLIHI